MFISRQHPLHRIEVSLGHWCDHGEVNTDTQATSGNLPGFWSGQEPAFSYWSWIEMNGLPLTIEDRALLAGTFAQLEPIRELAAGLFQERLLELAPDLARWSDIERAQHKALFMEVLSQVVASIVDGTDREGALRGLGRWHARYGIQRIHYGAMQEALLWMLRQTLSDLLCAEAQRAWRILFAHLRNVMEYAAAEERLALTVR